jgi:hypothetical protein
MEALPSQLLCPFVVLRFPDHPVILLTESLQRIAYTSVSGWYRDRQKSQKETKNEMYIIFDFGVA